MLFLGAGASKPFGIPTMKEFSKEILESVTTDEPAKKILHSTLKRLGEFGFKDPDIEAVMDVLTAKQDLGKAKLSIGPRVVEFAERNITIDYYETATATRLLTMIKGLIESRCAKANFKVSDAYYQQFFDRAPGGKMGTSSGMVPMGFQHIFTTNYDLCIDSYLRKHSCQNGFVDFSGYGRVFTGDWDQGNNAWTLCKLHGSVDWYEVGGRITQLMVVPTASFYDEKIEGRMMVYPASEKYALSSPYAECLFYLRQRLRTEQYCVVVGYSFRDAPINNAFTDALRLNPNLRIFSLSPRAQTHVAEMEEPLRSKIIPINAEFGADPVFPALQQAWNR
jgi:hypothetical protein